METAKKRAPARRVCVLLGKLAQAMKECVNKDHIRAKAVDSGR